MARLHRRRGSRERLAKNTGSGVRRECGSIYQEAALAQEGVGVVCRVGFGTHEALEILKFCFEHNITLCRLPSHISYKLQPCDVAVFGPLKTAYRDEVERLYRGGITVVNKEHFTTLYHPARERAMTKKNILAGWAKTGSLSIQTGCSDTSQN